MNRKIRIFMLVLVLVGASAATTNFSAAGILGQNNTFFSSVEGFFGNLFGGDDSDGTIVKPETRKITDPAADYATNTAYGDDGDEVETGTGVIDLTSDLSGLVIEKTITPVASPANTCTLPGGGTTDCLTIPSEEAIMSIEVKNTGTKDNETFTVTDDIDTYTSTLVYDINAPVTFTPGPEDATSPNTMTQAPKPATIEDLKTSGVVVTGVDSGDTFTLSFSVETLPVYSEKDYYMENTAMVCTPFGAFVESATEDENYGYVHNNAVTGLEEGTIYASGATASLCSEDHTEFPVDGNGDGGFTLPDLSWLESSKSVKDEDEDNIAEPGEVITYTLYAKNISLDLDPTDTDIKTITIIDNLDTPSMANVDFADPTNLYLPDGTTTFDNPATGKPYTIADLKTPGITVDLGPGEVLEFQFSGTVKDPIDVSLLEGDAAIRNIADFCGEEEDGTKVCEEKEVDIDTDRLAHLVDLEKDVTLFDEDEAQNYPSTPVSKPIVDTTSMGSGTIPATKPVIKYNIQVINTSSIAVPEDKFTLNLTDRFPTVNYLLIDDASTVTITITDTLAASDSSVVGGITSSTIGAIKQGTAGLDLEVGPGDIIDFEFDITLKDEVYAAGYKVEDELPIFTNTAILNYTEGGVGADEDYTLIDMVWATIDSSVVAGSDDDFNVSKYLVDYVDGTDPGNILGAIDAGDTMNYAIEIDNASDSPQIFSLYDAFDDVMFDLTIDPGINIALTGGEFVDDKGDILTTPPTDTSDLTDPANPVNIRVGAGKTATLTFSVVLSDSGSYSADTTPDMLINSVYVCKDSDKIDYTNLTSIEANTDCGKDTDVETMSDAPLIKVTKTSVDQNNPSPTSPDTGVSNEVGLHEKVDFTITVENTSIAENSFNYTLTDLYVDPNLVRDETAVVTLDAGTDGATTADIELTLGDILRGYTPTTSLDSGSTDTYTYTLDVKENTNGTPDLGDDTWTNDDFAYVTNLAVGEIGSVSRDGFPVRDYGYSRIKKEHTDDLLPDEVENIKVQKVMLEYDGSGALSPGDTEIAPGEEILVNFAMINSGDADGIVNLKEKDVLDPNIDWAASATNTLSITPLLGTAPTFATSYSDSTEPSATPTVADLVSMSGATPPEPVIKNGVYVNMPAKSLANVSFVVKMKDTANWVPKATVDNTMEYCVEDTPDILCDDSVTTVPTVGFEALEVQKIVTNSVDTLGNVNESDDGFLYGTDGGVVDYEIVAKNTGSIDLNTGTPKTLKFSDILDPSVYFDYDSTVLPDIKVTIKEYSEYIPKVYGDASTGVGTLETNVGTVDLGTLNGGATYNEVFESGHSMVFTFQVKLADNLNEFLITDETIPNVAEVCFDSKGLYELAVGTGTVCVEGSNELPYQKDGETVTNPDDPDFAVRKNIVDTDAALGELEPGEATTMEIQVTNADLDDSGLPKDILLTDELIDYNFVYQAIVETGEVSIKDTTSIPTGSTTTFPVYYATADAYTADSTLLDTEATNKIYVKNLLPDAGTTPSEFINPDGETRWPATGTAPDEGAVIANTDRGGVWLRIPANHTYTVSFDVSASGDLKMATRIKGVFDFRKYFA